MVEQNTVEQMVQNALVAMRHPQRIRVEFAEGSEAAEKVTTMMFFYEETAKDIIIEAINRMFTQMRKEIGDYYDHKTNGKN